MGELIYTTKNYGKTTRNASLICGIIIFLFGIILWVYGVPVDLMDSSRDDTGFYIGALVGVIPFGIAIVAFIMTYRYSQTYLNIYSDHVEGKGLMGVKHVNSLYFTYDRLVDITCESSWICVHSDGKIYKVYTTKSAAQELTNFIKSKMYNLGNTAHNFANR